MFRNTNIGISSYRAESLSIDPSQAETPSNLWAASRSLLWSECVRAVEGICGWMGSPVRRLGQVPARKLPVASSSSNWQGVVKIELWTAQALVYMIGARFLIAVTSPHRAVSMWCILRVTCRS